MLLSAWSNFVNNEEKMFQNPEKNKSVKKMFRQDFSAAS